MAHFDLIYHLATTYYVSVVDNCVGYAFLQNVYYFYIEFFSFVVLYLYILMYKFKFWRHFVKTCYTHLSIELKCTLLTDVPYLVHWSSKALNHSQLGHVITNMVHFGSRMLSQRACFVKTLGIIPLLKYMRTLNSTRHGRSGKWLRGRHFNLWSE